MNNGNGSPRGRGQGYTYNNSNQTGQRNNGRAGNSYSQNNVRNDGGQPIRGGRRPAQPKSDVQIRSGGGHGGVSYGRAVEMKQPISWVPIFAALLVLLISVGIFITVLNSRSRSTNAGNVEDTDTFADSAPDTLPQDGEDDGPSEDRITVSYASPTSKTAELGSSITSDYAIMIDLATNTVVAQKNPDATIFPASMTKIMTLIVAYENCDNFDDTFTMTAEITDPLFIAGASVAGFSVGEEITIRDLLYGAILPSGGDATDALAIYTAGSIEAFVEMMNRKVLQMGLSNTHFANPSGLHDDDHYSTPHEIALILEYALQIDECRKILSTYQYTTEATPEHPEGILLTSTMFSRMAGDESGVATVIAGKTGYTNEGLHCLASMARIANGKEYILVTAHAPSTYDPIYDCINVYKTLFGEE